MGNEPFLVYFYLVLYGFEPFFLNLILSEEVFQRPYSRNLLVAIEAFQQFAVVNVLEAFMLAPADFGNSQMTLQVMPFDFADADNHAGSALLFALRSHLVPAVSGVQTQIVQSQTVQWPIPL